MRSLGWLSFSHLIYFMLPRSVFILLKTNFKDPHAFWGNFIILVLLFLMCSWNRRLILKMVADVCDYFISHNSSWTSGIYCMCILTSAEKDRGSHSCCQTNSSHTHSPVQVLHQILQCIIMCCWEQSKGIFDSYNLFLNGLQLCKTYRLATIFMEAIPLC